MLQLDGSRGEGGGQILRTALALAVITGKPFEIVRIRAGRSKPGLRNQHLTCVRAAQAISVAETEGDALDSQQLLFRPQTLVGGTYHFEQPGAGSTMLVLQTVLPPLLLATEPSILTLTGGTHNPLAPPYDFIERSFAPLLRHMGAKLDLQLDQAGFFPAGGGRCQVRIQPCQKLQPLHLHMDQGRLQHTARILIAKLPETIATREAQALKDSHWRNPAIETLPGRGPGNLVLLESQGEQVRSMHAGFGIKGQQAEKVVAELLQRAKQHQASGMPVEEYLADQLLLPLALAGEGSFYASEISEHTRTNIETIKHFLPVHFEVGRAGKGWKLSVSAL